MSPRDMKISNFAARRQLSQITMLTIQTYLIQKFYLYTTSCMTAA